MSYEQSFADMPETTRPSPRDPVPPLSGSDFDTALLVHLERHVEREDEILGEYEALARDSADEPVRYLAGLVLEDERRHHRILTEMRNQLRSAVWFTDEQPRVPWLVRLREPERLRAAVRKLRRAERRDLRDLRRLRRRLGPLRRDSLHGVLVRTLEHDTRQHLRYLRTLGRLARR